MPEYNHPINPWDSHLLLASISNTYASDFNVRGAKVSAIHLTVALIYHRHGHVINVFIWPTRGSDRTAAFDKSQDGFNLIAWDGGDFQYWLISDVNLEELQQLSKLLRNVGS